MANRLALKTTLARRFDLTGDATFLNELVTLGEAWVWNYADWQFKLPPPTTLNLTISQPYSALDAGARDVINIFDDQGDTLEYVPPDEFQARFRYQILQGQRGKPRAFTTYFDDTLAEGLRVHWDLVPDQAYAFSQEYRRKLLHRDIGGAVVVGPMTGDTDVPFFGIEHHDVIVFAAALNGLILDNDPTYPPLQSARDEILAAMEEEYLTDRPLIVPPRVWGAGAGRRRWSR